MKALIVLISLLSLSARALNTDGVASEDRIVKKVQEAFTKAKAPSEETLLKGSWSCKHFSAVKGDFSITELNMPYRFAKEDLGIFRNDGAMGSTIRRYVMGTNALESSGGSTTLDFVRETDDGHLISELVKKNMKPEEGEPSVSDSSLLVSSYRFCTLKPLYILEKGRYYPLGNGSALWVNDVSMDSMGNYRITISGNYTATFQCSGDQHFCAYTKKTYLEITSPKSFTLTDQGHVTAFALRGE